MRILQLAPLWETVPPPAYGGTEAVVSVLVEELVRRGQDVTLWASGDSKTSAELRSIYHRSLRTASDLQERDWYALMHAAASLVDADSYDIIHNHIGETVMAMSHLVATPMLSTMHCLITPGTKFVWDRYEGWYNTISRSEKLTMPQVMNRKYAGTVYNAIDVASFPFSEKKDDYLLFLSRISVDKAPHLAIEVAKRLGRRIILAGKVDPNSADIAYFNEVLRPLLDGDRVRFLGEADSETKRGALQERARACLAFVLGRALWTGDGGSYGLRHTRCRFPARRCRGDHRPRRNGLPGRRRRPNGRRGPEGRPDRSASLPPARRGQLQPRAHDRPLPAPVRGDHPRSGPQAVPGDRLGPT